MVQRRAPPGTERPRHPPIEQRGAAATCQTEGRAPVRCKHWVRQQPGIGALIGGGNRDEGPGWPAEYRAEARARWAVEADAGGAGRRRSNAAADGGGRCGPREGSVAREATAVSDRPGARRRTVGAPMVPRPGELMPRCCPGEGRMDDGRPNPLGITAGRVVPLNLLGGMLPNGLQISCEGACGEAAR